MLERAARDRIDEEPRVEPVDDELRLVHRVQQHVELTAIDADRGVRVGGGSSARIPRADARRGGSVRRACSRAVARHRLAQAVGVDVELAGELHDVLVADEIARVLGDDGGPGLGRAGPALERGEVGGGEHAVEAELQERRGPLERTQELLRDRRATRRRGRGRQAGRRPASWIS